MYISDGVTVDLDYHTNWFSGAKEHSENQKSDKFLVEWLQGLEEAIKSGISNEDLRINLSRMMNEISSETIKEIVHMTYHS
jgi:hypothetical protein